MITCGEGATPAGEPAPRGKPAAQEKSFLLSHAIYRLTCVSSSGWEVSTDAEGRQDPRDQLRSRHACNTQREAIPMGTHVPPRKHLPRRQLWRNVSDGI